MYICPYVFMHAMYAMSVYAHSTLDVWTPYEVTV